MSDVIRKVRPQPEKPMSVTNVRAKAGKASEKVANLVRKARASIGDCVLVVYDPQHEAASIYYEGRNEPVKAPVAR